MPLKNHDFVVKIKLMEKKLSQSCGNNEGFSEVRIYIRIAELAQIRSIESELLCGVEKKFGGTSLKNGKLLPYNNRLAVEPVTARTRYRF